jgi:hypothetical protein
MLLYPFMAIGSLLTTLLSLLLNPIAILFAKQDANGQWWLPRWLWYFQTFDTPLPGGYLANLKWLTRNPAYGFDYYLWGVNWNPEDWHVSSYQAATDGSVLFVAFSTADAFNFYYSGSLFNFKFGWKAWNNYTNGKFDRNFGDGKRIPICLTIKLTKHSTTV